MLGTTQIEIEAPAEHVWAILVDFDAYGEWNPFTVGVVGEVMEGGVFVLDVRMPRPIKVRQRVYRVDAANHCLQWGIDLPAWLLHTERTQTVEPLSPHVSVYRTQEHVKGLLAPLVLMTSKKQVQAGFDTVATALKIRAEQ